MSKNGIYLILAIVLAALPVHAQTNIAKNNQPSVVCIQTVTDEITGFGSGFFVADDMIATNWHVADSANEIEVQTAAGQKCAGKLWVASPQHDLAIIKLKESFGKGKIVKIRTTPAQELETVYVCGHPEALAFSWSSGTVANSRRTLPPEIQDAPKCTLIQLNAAISHGSSGGPMFDAEGNVLGVITGQWEEGQNLNFAIPTEYLLELLKKGQNIELTRKEIWESSEWKEWRKSMASHKSWQEKVNAAAAVFNVHGPLAMIYVDLGAAAYKEGETVIARKSFVRATHYEPENPRAWVGMGLVELKENNKQKAIDDFKKTILLGKNDEEVILTACKGIERAGDRDLALTQLKKAIQANPSWSKASQAVRKLEQ